MMSRRRPQDAVPTAFRYGRQEETRPGKDLFMLADIIIARSAFGGSLDRDDIHRHATFYCAVRRFLRAISRAIAE